jgi:hypothetical protein
VESVKVGLLPSIGYEDIVDYLLVRKSVYTAEEFKAVKGLGAHNQLTSGWMRDLKVLYSASTTNAAVIANGVARETISFL